MVWLADTVPRMLMLLESDFTDEALMMNDPLATVTEPVVASIVNGLLDVPVSAPPPLAIIADDPAGSLLVALTAKVWLLAAKICEVAPFTNTAGPVTVKAPELVSLPPLVTATWPLVTVTVLPPVKVPPVTLTLLPAEVEVADTVPKMLILLKSDLTKAAVLMNATGSIVTEPLVASTVSGLATDPLIWPPGLTVRA